MKLLMSTKEQFKMYLDEDLVERLKQAATRFSRVSGQALAAEILSIYLPTWIAVNDSMRRAVEYQTKITSPKGERKANDIQGKPKGLNLRARSKSNSKPHIDHKELEGRKAGDSTLKKKSDKQET